MIRNEPLILFSLRCLKNARKKSKTKQQQLRSVRYLRTQRAILHVVQGGSGLPPGSARERARKRHSRERETERETERQRERDTETERDTERETQRETQRQRFFLIFEKTFQRFFQR